MKLALGTAQIGMDYGIQNNGKPSPEASLGLLNLAVAKGILTFDTAAAYGNAESILGQFLLEGGYERSLLRIVTKLALNPPDDARATDYRLWLEDEAEKSMDRLHTGYLDGLLYHHASDVFNDDAMNALVRVKRPGVINQIGISVYTPEEAARALEYDIDIIQVPYNVFDRRLDRSGFFERAHARGITVYARSPLLQGLLAMDPGKLPARMRFAKPYLTEYGSMCRELHLSRLECAVLFVAGHKHIDYMLFGADNAAQLNEVASAAAKEMDTETRRCIYDRFQDVPDQVVMPNLWPQG